MEDRAGPSMSTGAASKEAVEEALTKPIETMQLGNGSDASSQEPLAQSNGTANGTASAAGIEVGPEDDGAHSASGMPSSSLDEDNGHASMHDRPGEQMSENELRTELERVRNERNSFEGQYRGLLNKLGQMRSTLGDRLRQDAEELDRREQQIETLTARVEELQGTVETLKGELLASHQDVDRLTTDLDAARSLHQQQTNSASSDRKGTEARLREVQEVAERFRIDAEGWESACMEERARRDEIDLEIQEARRERDEALAREQEQTRIAARETDTARELQQVLEEFQAAQEGELQRALSEHEEKLSILAASLEEHMARTRDAEGTASEYKEAAERCQQLEKEVKEKNLLIGKLRHEAVILNEHLTESLRRLRANTSDSSVDGKLITNLLIQFLNTPRQDTKRFEMLSLIASVLHWGDEDRERAGLQRTQTGTPSGDRKKGSVLGAAFGKSPGHRRQGPSSGSATSPTGGEESFSNLFVEFLLSEAEQAKKPDSNATAHSSHISSKSSAPSSPKDSLSKGTSSRPYSPESPSTHRTSFNLGSLASIGRTPSESNAAQVKSP